MRSGGPKHGKDAEVPGTRYHIKTHLISGGVYEEVPLKNVQSTANLLARVLIAKIENEGRLAEILRKVPAVQGDPNWRCRTWLANALAAVEADGKAVGTAELDWTKIERVARDHVPKKRSRGRYMAEEDLKQPKPTWDMIEGKEIIP
ncbi:uncharacterized protein P884DRAFT_292594 [Thermothelomyces heterothallicus CBS 202.75]|uniref:uncharacterized protein n=1 Tax=Thermothelomyces heterothallicus CBS 202.75 TaxID=1149848 RepID=UPI00374417B8